MFIKRKMKRVFKSLAKLLNEKETVAIPKQINTTNMLNDKIALITGGSGGIGFGIAEVFVKNGCRVILCGTNENKLISLCDQLGDRAKYAVLDVLDIDSIPTIIDNIGDMFGEDRIDILVNSAGVHGDFAFGSIKEKDYDLVMDINVKGTFFLCQAMINYMQKRDIKGHILNVSSSSALKPAWTPYEMSKWAIRGFTKGLADTVINKEIIVNAIGPGPVATAMLNKKEGDSLYLGTNPSKRYALPNEIGNLAVFMVSDMGNLIVGDTFYISGGSGVISYS